MKVERTLTSKAIFYYSLTGKTEAILDKSKLNGISINKLNNIKAYDVDFKSYDILFIGSPSYGRGIPPDYFRDLIKPLVSLQGKRIGLFGSGNTIYGDDFCGALDVLEELLGGKNQILFKYRFEGYPRQTDIDNLTKLIMEA
jgi:flavodoxin I